LPSVQLCASDGSVVDIPAVDLSLDIAAIGLSRRYGASWTERVLRLRASYGPCALAFLEALFRAADVQASRTADPDPLIADVVLA
jgi:hypothetical protein